MGTGTAFWTAVNQEFSLIEFHGSRTFTNAQKAVAACVAERKKQLENPESGHNSITDSWTQVVDTYIRYEDEEKAQIEQAKARAKRHRDQVYDSNQVRLNLVKDRRNKETLDEEGYSPDSNPATEDRDDYEDRPSFLGDDDEGDSSLGPLDSVSPSLAQGAALSPVSNTPSGEQNRTQRQKKRTQMVRPNGRKKRRSADQQLDQTQAMDMILNAVNGLGQDAATSAEVSAINERIRSLEMRLEAQINTIMELKATIGKLEGMLMMTQGFGGFRGGLQSNNGPFQAVAEMRSTELL